MSHAVKQLLLAQSQEYSRRHDSEHSQPHPAFTFPLTETYFYYFCQVFYNFEAKLTRIQQIASLARARKNIICHTNETMDLSK